MSSPRACGSTLTPAPASLLEHQPPRVRVRARDVPLRVRARAEREQTDRAVPVRRDRGVVDVDAGDALETGARVDSLPRRRTETPGIQPFLLLFLLLLPRGGGGGRVEPRERVEMPRADVRRARRRNQPAPRQRLRSGDGELRG